MSDHDSHTTNEPDTRELADTLAAMRAMRNQGSSGRALVRDLGIDDPMSEAIKKLPGKGNLIRQAPAIAMICGTVIFTAILVTFGTLVVIGKPTDELFRLTNLFLNATGAIGVLATLVVAIGHARRITENRRVTQAVGAEVHLVAKSAADNAQKAATSARSVESAVNGELDARLAAMEDHIVDRLLRRLEARSREGRPPG